MPVVHKESIEPFTQKQMFDLVNDVSQYKEFIPYCTSSDVLSRNKDEVRASLGFSKGAMSKSFATINRLQPNKMMELKLLNGPFKHLEGFWKFEVISEQQTRVVLALEFEFSNKIMAMMFGSVFNQAANSLVSAFTKRAKQVYGSD